VPLLGHFYIARDMLGFAERFRALGDVVKLRLPPHDVYVLNQPRDIEQLLVVEHERFRKDWTTRILEHIIGQGLLVNEGAAWRKQRRIIQPEFTPRRIDSYVASMTECTERALSRLAQRTERMSTGPCDLHAEMLRLTLDIAGQTMFGAETESVAQELAAIIEQFLQHYLGVFGTGIRLPAWLPTRGNRQNRVNQARLRTIIREFIAARRQATTPGNDLLSRLIAARDEQGQPMPDGLLADEAITMLLAGHETTALLLTFALMLLAQHPEVAQRVCSELTPLCGKKPTPAELENLPYLDAVLRETLRLYPPAYAIGREALEDTQIGTCTIPRGAQVWAFQWTVQRDPRFYPEPTEFRPERWLTGETAQLPRFAYFPFGGGPRICPGSHFSLVEAKVVLAMLLPRWSFQLVSQTPIKLVPSVTIRPKGGLWAHVRARS
jgi:cytochrome P450